MNSKTQPENPIDLLIKQIELARERNLAEVDAGMKLIVQRSQEERRDLSERLDSWTTAFRQVQRAIAQGDQLEVTRRALAAAITASELAEAAAIWEPFTDQPLLVPLFRLIDHDFAHLKLFDRAAGHPTSTTLRISCWDDHGSHLVVRSSPGLAQSELQSCLQTIVAAIIERIPLDKLRFRLTLIDPSDRLPDLARLNDPWLRKVSDGEALLAVVQELNQHLDYLFNEAGCDSLQEFHERYPEFINDSAYHLIVLVEPPAAALNSTIYQQLQRLVNRGGDGGIMLIVLDESAAQSRLPGHYSADQHEHFLQDLRQRATVLTAEERDGQRTWQIQLPASSVSCAVALLDHLPYDRAAIRQIMQRQSVFRPKTVSIRFQDLFAQAPTQVLRTHRFVGIPFGRKPGYRSHTVPNDPGRLGCDLVLHSGGEEFDYPLTHCFILGATGSGKSNLVRVILASGALHYGPDELAFVIIDPKGGKSGYRDFEGLKHLCAIAESPDDVQRVLACLRSIELRRRTQYGNYNDSRQRGVQLPRIVVIVEEALQLDEQTNEHLREMLRTSRDAGIHFILVAQESTARSRFAEALRSIEVRIGMRIRKDAIPYAWADKKPEPMLWELERGEAYLQTGSDPPLKVQVAYLDALSESKDWLMARCAELWGTTEVPDAFLPDKILLDALRTEAPQAMSEPTTAASMHVRNVPTQSAVQTKVALVRPAGSDLLATLSVAGRQRAGQVHFGEWDGQPYVQDLAANRLDRHIALVGLPERTLDDLLTISLLNLITPVMPELVILDTRLPEVPKNRLFDQIVATLQSQLPHLVTIVEGLQASYDWIRTAINELDAKSNLPVAPPESRRIIFSPAPVLTAAKDTPNLMVARGVLAMRTIFPEANGWRLVYVIDNEDEYQHLTIQSHKGNLIDCGDKFVVISENTDGHCLCKPFGTQAEPFISYTFDREAIQQSIESLLDTLK